MPKQTKYVRCAQADQYSKIDDNEHISKINSSNCLIRNSNNVHESTSKKVQYYFDRHRMRSKIQKKNKLILMYIDSKQQEMAENNTGGC